MITRIQARSILTRSRSIDDWFVSRHGMNLYRGCAHACAYCDGRAEKYRVEGVFGQDITVKTNAVDLLRAELAREKEPGFVFLGGGVCDAYQPAEAEFRLARGALEAILQANHPDGTLFTPKPRFSVHILTKSTLVERDVDLLERIPGAMVSVSLSTMDPDLAALVEPGCPPPEARIRMLERMRARGLGTGVMLMPVLPFLSDTEDALDATMRRTREAGVDFVLFGGLTLKVGRQKDHFLNLISEHHPGLRHTFDVLYDRPDGWGRPRDAHLSDLETRYVALARRHGLPGRIPLRLFRGRVPLQAEASMMLAHLHELLRMQGIRRDAYARAATAVLDLPELRDLALERRIPGFGPTLSGILAEWAETGTSRTYERVLAWDVPVGAA